MGDRPAPAPQAPRRDLDERHAGPDRLFEPEPVPIRPARQEVVAERLERPRLLVHEGAAHRHDLVEVDAGQALAELSLLDPIHDRLDERPEAPRVACGDEVDRPAHERHPDHRAVDEQVGELLAPEVVEPRPQPDIGRVRRLGLHPDEMLEGRRDRQLDRRRRSCRSSVARFSARRPRVSPVAARASAMVPPRVPRDRPWEPAGRGRCIGDRQASTARNSQRRRSQPCAATSPGSSVSRPRPRSRSCGSSPRRSRRPATRATTTSACRTTSARPTTEIKLKPCAFGADRREGRGRIEGHVRQRSGLHPPRDRRQPGVGIARRRDPAGRHRLVHVRHGGHLSRTPARSTAGCRGRSSSATRSAAAGGGAAGAGTTGAGATTTGDSACERSDLRDGSPGWTCDARARGRRRADHRGGDRRALALRRRGRNEEPASPQAA